MIEAHHVSKMYSRGVYALRDLSLRVDKGEFVFLTGPSGAGKSTLLENKTVLENVAFVPRVLGMGLSQQQRKTFQVLKWVGLQHRMNAYPMELSGGEQQRIAIARALVNDPLIILADEPTGNLDPDLSLEIMNLLREINAGGTTVVVATHDRELIRLVGRRTVTLDQGRIVEVA